MLTHFCFISCSFCSHGLSLPKHLPRTEQHVGSFLQVGKATFSCCSLLKRFPSLSLCCLHLCWRKTMRCIHSWEALPIWQTSFFESFSKIMYHYSMHFQLIELCRVPTACFGWYEMANNQYNSLYIIICKFKSSVFKMKVKKEMDIGGMWQCTKRTTSCLWGLGVDTKRRKT